MSMSTAVTLALLAVVSIIVVSLYNRIVALKRRCDQAYSDIDVQLKQRHDLIPNLVETVKGYASHERGTLEAVTKARAAAQAATTPAAQMQAETALSGALGRLMMLGEAYPQLQASGNFTQLSSELADVENKIAAARRFFNGAVTEYNTTREQFPANLVVALFGMGESRSTFDVGSEARQQLQTAPSVRF